MIQINRINPTGVLHVIEICGIAWFKCQNPTCRVAIHYVIDTTHEGAEVNREEYIRLSHLMEIVFDENDIPLEAFKSDEEMEEESRAFGVGTRRIGRLM